MENDYNFSGVESAENNNSYLKPGIYKVNATDAKYESPTDKTPFLQITFGSEQGILREKFYITPKTLPRLQYLHEAWFNKKLEKAFRTSEEVGSYFTKAFTSPQRITDLQNCTVTRRASSRWENIC